MAKQMGKMGSQLKNEGSTRFKDTEVEDKAKDSRLGGSVSHPLKHRRAEDFGARDGSRAAHRDLILV